MDLTTLLLGIAIASCIYMACNIGANDVANAMGTSVGAKTLTYKQAILIAAVAEFVGALFVGGHVSDTIRKGMLDPTLFSAFPMHLVYGMIASLIAAAIWLHVASYLGWPVSTTHSIVGAVVGFGLIAGGIDAINWGQVVKVVLSWVISPVMGALFAYLIFRFIHSQIFNKRDPLSHAKKIAPFLVFIVCVILVNSMVYKGLKNLHLDLTFFGALKISFLVGIAGYIVAKIWASRVKDVPTDDIHGQLVSTENLFKVLQVITAFYVAFAHGSNDVANAVGPLAAVVSILVSGEVQMKVEMPVWILAMGGGFIVFGLFVWG
ncbi:MAG: inorganic phosphate transporter, partial [Nitrospinales bacterium]